MKQTICIILGLSIFISCGKKELPEEEKLSTGKSAPANRSDIYFPRTAGSYWVYERALHNPDSSIQSISRDSVYIVKDTVYNGRKATKIKGFTITSFYSYIHDSAGFLFDGANLLVPATLTPSAVKCVMDQNQVNDTAFCARMIYKEDQAVTVPAGSFKSLKIAMSSTLGTGSWDPSTSRVRENLNYYVKGVGMVEEVLPFLSGPYYRRRLVKYKIN